jgi:hypothetical protein
MIDIGNVASNSVEKKKKNEKNACAQEATTPSKRQFGTVK